MKQAAGRAACLYSRKACVILILNKMVYPVYLSHILWPGGAAARMLSIRFLAPYARRRVTPQ